MNSIGERMDFLIKTLGISKTKFAISIGVGSQYVSRLTSDSINIGLKLMSQIEEAFPEVNFNWLLFGKGEMFLNDETNIVEEEPAVYDVSEKKIPVEKDFSIEVEEFKSKNIEDKLLEIFLKTNDSLNQGIKVNDSIDVMMDNSIIYSKMKKKNTKHSLKKTKSETPKKASPEEKKSSDNS
ncbi:helix-turn-helix domain-containing protein [Aureivirga marina]|uniref:helix-turn-helix domain-containing protein n=1 Tax=Aureivirga marina TaxID=1182451 RepID=UPI0018CBDF13|nr:helix-turn-helix transcriptional regulator [Aureivirga marina]